MAEETKKPVLEREYVIPLRREWMKMEEYRRAGRAAKAIKKFIAKHMKVSERDTDKVKLDVYLNQELWARGVRNPPAKIKVKAVKEGEIVKVELVDIPEHVKFVKAKQERIHKEAEEKPKAKEEKPKEKKVEETKEEKAEEEQKKENEVEKEKAGEEQMIKEAKVEKQVQKHAAKGKNVEFHRRSMDRH